jgi:hypothetical protein
VAKKEARPNPEYASIRKKDPLFFIGGLKMGRPTGFEPPFGSKAKSLENANLVEG